MIENRDNKQLLSTVLTQKKNYNKSMAFYDYIKKKNRVDLISGNNNNIYVVCRIRVVVRNTKNVVFFNRE